MQTDTQHNHDSRVLSEQILNIFVQNPNPYDCVTALLEVMLEVIEADGAGLITFGEDGYCVALGNLDCEQIPANFESLEPQTARENGWVHEADLFSLPIYQKSTKQLSGAVYVSISDASLINDAVTRDLFIDIFTMAIANIQLYQQKTRAEQLSKSVLNSTIDPLLIIDQNKQVIHLNPAAEKVFSITTQEAYSLPLSDVIHSDELLQLSGGKNKNQVEWISEGNKTFIPRTEPVINAQGQTEGWVLTLRDISHFKKLNRNQYEFTRNVTHDLRSPLTSMQGFASMLELGAVGELNEKQAHFIEKILSGINQIAVLVDNIQDAGRYDPETGFYEMSREHCDLLELAQRIAENHLVPAEKGELQLSVRVADNVPIINADPTMLERALRNLVDNAIKYTPNGGTITVGVEKQDELVIISVADSGLGIGPEDQKRLFERGVRIHRAEHKKVKGSGLGLFIVRSVAQRHGGDAWVESDIDKGSTFFISIPLEGPNLIGYDET